MREIVRRKPYAKHTQHQKVCSCGKSFIGVGRKVFCDSCAAERKVVLGLEDRRRIKKEVFNAYGGACVCCGLDDWRFLSIDHIHNDGAEERRELYGAKNNGLSGGGGHIFYVRLRQLGFPKGRHQLLCHNCNMAKQVFGICPHQDNSVGEPIVKPKTNYKPGPQDNCGTPMYALDPLLPYLKKDWAIWEPAAGDGMMVRGLEYHGYTVIGSDISSDNDFLLTECEGADAIVTNPPYSQKPQFIRRCYSLGLPFALLLPVETIGSGRVQKMMKSYGVELLLLDKRVNFFMPNKGFDGAGAQFPVLWYCWKLLPQQICYGEINRTGDAVDEEIEVEA